MMTADGPAEIGTTVYLYEKGELRPWFVTQTFEEVIATPACLKLRAWFKRHSALTPERTFELAIARAHTERGREEVRAALARWKRENSERGPFS